MSGWDAARRLVLGCDGGCLHDQGVRAGRVRFLHGESSLNPSSENSAGGSSNFLGSMTIGGSYPGSVTIGEVDGSAYIVVILTNEGTNSTTTVP